MQREIPAAIAAAGLAGASLMLGSCALFDKLGLVSRPAHRPDATARAPSSRSASTGPRAEGSAAIWGLRAGLNVAALSCRGRGRQPVASHYARMLSRHRGLLAAAYRQAQARQSTSAFDRQQTRIYNTFANQTSPARFCNAASSVAQRANGLDSASFALAAPRLLGELRASLRGRP